MRVLVLGYGSMGRRHAANAKALGHTVLVVDTSGDRCLQALRDDVCDWSGDTVGKSRPRGIDACVIATPVLAHIAIAGELLACGYSGPILIEKPLARTAMEAVPFAACGRLQVGYNLRFHSGLQELRHAMPDVGYPQTGTFSIQCDKTSWPGRAYEDMLLEASHEIDLAQWLFGRAAVAGAVGAGDRWTLLLRHLSAAAPTSVVHLDGTYRGYRRYAEVRGPDGVLTWCWHGQDGSWRWDLSGPGVPLGAGGVCCPEDTYRAELQNFLRHVAGGHQVLACTFEDGLAVLHVCDEARRLVAAETVNRLTPACS